MKNKMIHNHSTSLCSFAHTTPFNHNDMSVFLGYPWLEFYLGRLSKQKRPLSREHYATKIFFQGKRALS
jgi:hypothetical protein